MGTVPRRIAQCTAARVQDKQHRTQHDVRVWRAWDSTMHQILAHGAPRRAGLVLEEKVLDRSEDSNEMQACNHNHQGVLGFVGSRARRPLGRKHRRVPRPMAMGNICHRVVWAASSHIPDSTRNEGASNFNQKEQQSSIY
ncbi:hypothetical protein HAX54_037804 [Datura stramonium]|uniref:Uncharacterized protein n=1 Tax=Datura stramonium TaxID=4076 RepID=A0ABS8VMS1_DATST|nr:hypothetical protein [Datura stramonium]